MALQINDSFQINSAVPIDTRIMLTKNEMLNIDENLMPDVYFAICTDGKFYLYNKTNSKDPTTGKFRVLEGSGSAKIDKWGSKKSYNPDDLVVYNNAIFQCKNTNNDTVFDKAKWVSLTGDKLFEVIEKTTIDIDTDLQEGNFIVKGKVEGVTLDELVNIHKDTNICIITTLGGRVIKFDKTTGTYAKTEDKFITAKEVHNELYHLETIPEHIELCSSTEPNARKIVETVSDPNTEISLTDAKAKVLDSDFHNYIEGDFVKLVAEQKDVETTTYIPRNEGYTRKQINDKIANLTVKGASDSKDVLYDVKVEPSIDNVRSALDKLFAKVYYVVPQITSFVANPTGGLFEKGETITAPTFTWTYNKDIKTQTLTDIVLTDNTDRTATFGNNITTNKTFTLSASDGEKSVTKSISYKFVDPIYTGVVANGTAINEAALTGLNKEITEAKTIEKAITSNFQTIVFASVSPLVDLINANGFSVLSSAVKESLTLTNGTVFNVYKLENINVTGFKYTLKF